MLEGKQVNIKVGGDFDPIPADKYTVLIADVNLVTQFNKWKGEDQELLNYQYIVLDDKAMDGDETTRGRYLWHRMSQSLSSKSWLMKLAKAVVGRELTREEMEKFDPEALIGKQVDVMVEQNPSKDGSAVYNNVISYAKNLKALEPVDFNAGQSEKEVESTPVETPNLMEGGLDLEDAFAESLEKESEEAEEELTAEEVAEMEAKLKKAKAKAKSATAKA